VVLATTVFIDVARPGTFSDLHDRAAGFGQNPNRTGFVLVSLCCGILSYDRVRLVDLLVLGLTALAVLSTLSRAAAIMLACVTVGYTGFVVRRAWRRGVHIVFLRLAGLVLLIGATYGAATVLLGQTMFTGSTSNLQTRLGMLRGRVAVVGPEDSRIQVAREGWEMVRESPFLGYGSGFTYVLPVGPHNIYLSRWLDNGFLGALAVVWLFGAMGVTFWRRRYTGGLLFTAVVTLEGFFSHNLFEERVFFVMLGVFLTLSSSESFKPATRSAAPALRWRISRSSRPADALATHR
jgi:O-antigen ligase